MVLTDRIQVQMETNQTVWEELDLSAYSVFVCVYMFYMHTFMSRKVHVHIYECICGGQKSVLAAFLTVSLP